MRQRVIPDNLLYPTKLHLNLPLIFPQTQSQRQIQMLRVQTVATIETGAEMTNAMPTVAEEVRTSSVAVRDGTEIGKPHAPLIGTRNLSQCLLTSYQSRTSE